MPTKAELTAEVEYLRKHVLALIESAQKTGVLIYECNHCAWIGNPADFGKRCTTCGGTCLPVFFDNSEPYKSNLLARIERERKEADMPDKPTLRELTDTGASVQRIVEYVRTRLKQPERRVEIRFGVMGDKWDAGLGRHEDCVSGPLGEPNDTLVGLLDSIVEDIDGMHQPDQVKEPE